MLLQVDLHGTKRLGRTVAGQEAATPVGREEDVAGALDVGQPLQGGTDVLHRGEVAQGVVEIVEQGERPGLDATGLGGGQRAEEGVAGLLVGHHGSRYSTSEELLETVTPEVGVVSVGSNSYGHPTRDALLRLTDAGVTVYRTDLQGNIYITVN